MGRVVGIGGADGGSRDEVYWSRGIQRYFALGWLLMERPQSSSSHCRYLLSMPITSATRRTIQTDTPCVMLMDLFQQMCFLTADLHPRWFTHHLRFLRNAPDSNGKKGDILQSQLLWDSGFLSALRTHLATWEEGLLENVSPLNHFGLKRWQGKYGKGLKIIACSDLLC